VIALGVVVAGRGNWGRLPFMKTRNVYSRGNTRHDKYVSKVWSTHVLGTNATACCVCRVCHVCCPKLVVNRNWWCGAGQTLAPSLDGSSCVP
jgi:hypothetical protein